MQLSRNSPPPPEPIASPVGDQQSAGSKMLSVRSVRKRFGATAPIVLESIDLDMAEGEFVSLLGPSGCGKTTLLRIVAGILPATDGAVYLDDVPVEGPSRDKAVVFQHFNLLPWRTTLGNAAYGLEVQGVGKAERNERATNYLHMLGLKGYENHYPNQISGGMKQRVGLARALAIEPRLMLMDEPFGALDALTREHLQAELQKIAATRNLTILFVTHSIDEALYLSDRIVVMGRHPGRKLIELEVPFTRPRSTTEIHADPEFARLRNEIWLLLEKEIGVTGDDPPPH
jgi:NitT/TauT family transport system ATP-binding protein